MQMSHCKSDTFDLAAKPAIQQRQPRPPHQLHRGLACIRVFRNGTNGAGVEPLALQCIEADPRCLPGHPDSRTAVGGQT
jgi:hypothetical protein